LSFKLFRPGFFFMLRQPMSLASKARVAAPLFGPLTDLQRFMMDEQCPLAGFTSDHFQTTADACFTPRAARHGSAL
ncbi:hypothetical protein GOODEAATRI_007863, partial [Goodea atripinnis]